MGVHIVGSEGLHCQEFVTVPGVAGFPIKVVKA
jgi:hypothetical protein